MENQLLSLLQEMKVSQDKMEANQEQLKVSQDKMKEETKDEVKSSLDVMKTVQDKMLVGLEEMKEETKSEMVLHSEESEERIQQVELEMLQVQQDMQQIASRRIINIWFHKCGENLQEFETDVTRLVRLAYPTAPDSFLEQLAVQTFVDGLRDSETQQ
ncbi:hypothetical protein CBL_08606 [Carabus blaptoides fortunei]